MMLKKKYASNFRFNNSLPHLIVGNRKEIMNELQHLLNKVNKVTAYHRHGNKIPLSALDDLSNAQIEYEKAIQVEAKVKPACEWVLVKDRLPEVDVRVLVYVEDLHIDKFETNANKILFGYLRSSGKIKPDGCLGDYNVTKWMPLPKP